MPAGLATGRISRRQGGSMTKQTAVKLFLLLALALALTGGSFPEPATAGPRLMAVTVTFPTPLNCWEGHVKVTGAAGVSGTFEVSVDGTVIDSGTRSGNFTLNYLWMDYPSLDICVQHTLTATIYGVTNSAPSPFGGSACCLPKECYTWTTTVTDNNDGTWTYEWCPTRVGANPPCKPITRADAVTCAGLSESTSTPFCVSATLPYPPTGTVNAYVRVGSVGGVGVAGPYTLEGPGCQYALCSQTRTGELITTGEWYWDDLKAQLCRDDLYQLYDQYFPAQTCGTATDTVCQDYTRCTESVRGEAVPSGDWYWDGQQGKLCRALIYPLYDKYDPTYQCGTEPGTECTEYTRCNETVRGEAVPTGDWYWDENQGKLCRDIAYPLYDKYDRTYQCGTEPGTECKQYARCNETVRGEAIPTGDWYWDGEQGKLCRAVTYPLYDKYDPTYQCGTEPGTECVDYTRCTETVRGDAVPTGGWYWDEAQGLLCRPVAYSLYDKYDRGYQCGTEPGTECEGYTPCVQPVRGEQISRTGPVYVDGQLCYQTTYAMYDPQTRQRCPPDEVVFEDCRTYIPCAPENRVLHRSEPPFYVGEWQDRKGEFCRTVQYHLYDAYTDELCQDCYHEEEECRRYTRTPTMTPTPTLTPTPPPFRTPVWTPTATPTVPLPALPVCPSCVSGVVFQSDRDGNWEIYRVDMDSLAQTRLTYDSAADTAPSWHPSGAYVVFQSNRDGNWEIYTMDALGGYPTNVSRSNGSDVAPSWACRYIFFQSDRAGNWEIYRMNVDGSKQTRLTFDAAEDAQPSASTADRVAFQSHRDGNWEIYTMNADGSDVRRLTNTSWDEVSPAWSPDGSEIAFQTRRWGTWQLAVMNLDGSNVRYLTHSGSNLAESPQWSPVCDWVAFQGWHEGDWDIYRVSTDGRIAQRLVYDPRAQDLLDDGVLGY